MAGNRTIDDIDRRILTLLQDNARISQSDIAKAVGLAPSAVMERIRKLETRGFSPATSRSWIRTP